jgi:putative two-component system response regulator
MSSKKAKILVVDDEKFYIDVVVELLSKDYKVVVAMDGEQALRRAVTDPPPDLILLDIMMPGMDGYEVCKRLKEIPVVRDIPVIFLTVKSEVADELKGFALGAVDYIQKPVSPPIVKARVATHLTLNRARRELADQNQLLELRVQKRTAELNHTKDVAIYCMASLAETRDTETGKHILRTQNYVRILAQGLKEHPRFSAHLNDEIIEMLYKTSPLHDIGKVGVPDHILLKPGKLTPDEWEEMKKHTLYGHEALLRAEQELGSTDFVQMAREIAITHHEWWNGTGYPRGLVGENIPVSGRLMAVADVYDALISRRAYKDPRPHEEAVKTIIEGAGHHLDPDIVAEFVARQAQFQEIALRYSDEAH